MIGALMGLIPFQLRQRGGAPWSGEKHRSSVPSRLACSPVSCGVLTRLKRLQTARLELAHPVRPLRERASSLATSNARERADLSTVRRLETPVVTRQQDNDREDLEATDPHQDDHGHLRDIAERCVRPHGAGDTE